MFNVTVLKAKDIIKGTLGCISLVIIIVVISKVFSSKNKEEIKVSKISVGSLISCLEEILPTVSGVYEENKEIIEKENIVKKDYLEEFLKTEISSMKVIEQIEEKGYFKEVEQDNKEQNQNEETNKDNIEKKENNNIILVNTEHIDTEVVTQNPIAENFNVQYANIKIKNQTSYTLTDDMLEPNITIDNKNILIFHTHSCESYTASEKYTYTQTGNYRTTDLNYTVTRVGTELENYLKQYDLNVIHDTSYHDYPSYNGSYTRSLETVENTLQTTQSDIIIDLHRDAIGSREDYAPTVKIGDDYCAQIRFVIRYK